MLAAHMIRDIWRFIVLPTLLVLLAYWVSWTAGYVLIVGLGYGFSLFVAYAKAPLFGAGEMASLVQLIGVFGAIIILFAGWLIVVGIRRWRRKA